LVTDGISIISGNNSVETIAANAKYLEFKNNKTFEVGTVSASVNAIPSSVIADTKDFAQVQGILSKESVLLTTKGQILINNSMTADEYVIVFNQLNQLNFFEKKFLAKEPNLRIYFWVVFGLRVGLLFVAG